MTRRGERPSARARRAAVALQARLLDGVLGQQASSTELHDERLDAVLDVLRGAGVRSVLDLGCGSGALLARLVEDERFARIVGVDASAEALATAERRLGAAGAEGRWELRHGSFLDPAPELAGLGAAVLVEALEHVAPGELSRVERAVFGVLRPALVVLTTPNRDYNVRYGLAEGELRHPDHRFEWTRGRFRDWARSVGGRNGYAPEVSDVGRGDPLLGAPTQMGVFRRLG